MAIHSRGRRFSLSHSYFAFLSRRKASDRLLFVIACIALLVSGIYAIRAVNAHFATNVPISGGSFTEGIVGIPRFVNPVLAINRADHDMVALIYSGLLKIDENGNLVPDVAESVTLSDDGLTYHVVLRHGVHFQDGSELTAKDVAYTIGLIQNPELKSPLLGNWDGVQVNVIDDYTMDIILQEPYTPFKENLTFGILPRSLWSSLPAEQVPFSQNNTEPIGSGPYKITSVVHSKSGLITSYKLAAFNDGKSTPNITSLAFNFYETDQDLLKALADGAIASTPSLSTDELTQVDTNKYAIEKTPLPRTFAVYFNENKSAALRDDSVRKALDAAIDKDQLVATVLKGYGIPTNSPIPPGFLDVESTSSSQDSPGTTTDPISRAAAILTAGGWKKTDAGWQKEIDKDTVTLSVSLSTASTSLFDSTANYIANAWKTLGVAVTVNEFEQADLVQAAIRPRDFEALLYGADIGRQADLYPFWHSSQKSDPGLNIAQYANIDADALLQKARTAADEKLREENLTKAAGIIASEHPAIFLFVPTFNYVIDKNIAIAPLQKLGDPSDRFANIAAWYTRSNDLWPIFSNKK